MDTYYVISHLDCEFTFVLSLLTWITLIHGLPLQSIRPIAKSDLKVDIQNVLNAAKMLSAAVNTTLTTYCRLSINNCRQFTKMLLNQLAVPFPQLYLQNNITINQRDLLNMALFNMSTTLIKYAILIKNQLKREKDSLCAPAKRIAMPCYYPYACSKLIPSSNAIFYCYLRQVELYLTDMNLMISSNTRDKVKVHDRLLVSNDTPIIYRRWFTMVTLQTILEHINLIEQRLQLYVGNI